MRRARPAKASTPDTGREPETVGFRRRREKRERGQAFLAGKPLVVGLDLGKVRHAVWLTRPELGDPVRRLMVAHSHEGLTKLLALTEEERTAGEFDRVIVFMEPTSHFWKPVADFLERHKIDYKLVASLAVARQREIEHLTHAKGDYRDAELIAQLGTHGQWLRRTLESDPLWIQLDTLAREHEHLLEDAIREELSLSAFLELVLPEFLLAFKDPLGQAARALLKVLATPPACSFEEVRERTRAFGQTSKLRARKVEPLLAHLEARTSFGVERLLPFVLPRIRLAVDRSELFRHQREELREQLVAVYRTTPYHTFLDTVPGVAPENHALLLGLVGDPKKYDRASCLVKLAGSEPRENQSGQAEGSHSISHRGKPMLRHLAYRVAWGLSHSNPELSSYFHRVRKREANPLNRQEALCALGNKWIRLVYRLCVSGSVYDPKRLAVET